MLTARAYSFRLKARLAISLGWIAGFVNVVAFLACGTMTSHVTGNATIALLRNVEGQRDLAGYAAFAVAAFFAGALASGVLTEGARRAGWKSKYVVPVAIEAFLLLLVAAELRRTGAAHAHHDQVWWKLVGLSACAMGMQNATVTRISGSVVRTTHLTGVLTDLGIEVVQFVHWWRDRSSRSERTGRLLRIVRREPSLLRILLLLSIFGSFVFGAAAGAWAFSLDPSLALVAPVAFLGWIVWIDVRTPIADVREIDALDDPDLRAAGIAREIVPHDVAIFRLHDGARGRAHRAPDFHLWVERLPPHKRVLILVLSPATAIDDDAAQDLREGANRLSADRRRLVLAGVTPAHHRAFERHGLLRAVPPENVLPDLEFALARAIALSDAARRE